MNLKKGKEKKFTGTSKPCIVKTNLESFTKESKLEVAYTKYFNLKQSDEDQF